MYSYKNSNSTTIDSNTEVFDSLKANSLILSPNEKSKEFSNFISDIMDFCYSYSEVFESYVPGEKINSYDLEFRNSMEKIYLKIQKFYIFSSSENMPIWRPGFNCL